MLFNRRDIFYDEKFPNISNRVKYFKEEKKEGNIVCKAVEEYGKKCAREAEKRGIECGIERGIERGKNEEKLNNALNMLNKNFPIDDIIYVTGLSKKEIENLK